MVDLRQLDQNCPMCGVEHGNSGHLMSPHNGGLDEIVFSGTAPEMVEALEFCYPCGKTGHQLNKLPVDYCDECPIDTNDCIDFFTNEGRPYTSPGRPDMKKKKQLTFEEYMKYKRANTARKGVK